MQTPFRTSLTVGLAFLLSSMTRAAEWRVVVLHPQGDESSIAWAASARLQGGYAAVPEDGYYFAHPIIWSSSPNDYLDLIPPGWRVGEINGMDGPYQAGYVSNGRNPRAALWTGSVESFVDLTPASYGYGTVYAVAGVQQVGSVGPPGPRAALWLGTPDSFVELHPPTARYSLAGATDGDYQAGWANLPEYGEIHAVLWHGSAQGWVDMNPDGARESVITGMAPGIQVGEGLFSTHHYALLWHGSPESVIIMHPTDGYDSRLSATTGRVHAGYVNYTGWAEAGVWIGEDPESFINLHVYLSKDYFASAAYAIAIDRGVVYVAGTASHGPSSQPHAVVWIGNSATKKELPPIPASPAIHVKGHPKRIP